MNRENDKELNSSKTMSRAQDSLASIRREANELSRVSAIVNLAYIRAKISQRAAQRIQDFGRLVDDKIKLTAGTIKGNSKLYDASKAKKAELCMHYKAMLGMVTSEQDRTIGDLLAKRAELESQNVTLAIDSAQLNAKNKRKQEEYEASDKAREDEETAEVIKQKKAETEKLAKSGDIDGATKAIDEYKKMKNDLLLKSTEDMIELAKTAHRVNENREMFKGNRAEIASIKDQIEEAEQAANKAVDKASEQNGTDIVAVDKKASMFNRIARFASNAVTRIFNKRKAISNALAQIEQKIQAETIALSGNITTEVGLCGNSAEPYKDRVYYAIEAGNGVRESAIGRVEPIQEQIEEVADR